MPSSFFVPDPVAIDALWNEEGGAVWVELEKIGKEGVAIAQRFAPVGSAPQDTPGALRDSIRSVILEAEPGVMIGSDLPYALYVEFGTFDTPAQPFLRPTLDIVKP